MFLHLHQSKLQYKGLSNLKFDTISKKQLNLALCLSHIEKRLDKNLTRTEIEESLARIQNYVLHAIIVILLYQQVKTLILKKVKEKRKVIVKNKARVMWMFYWIENKIIFLVLDLMYFVLILFACGV